MHSLKCLYLQVTFVCISYKSRSCIVVFACEEIYVLYFRARPVGNLYRWPTCRGPHLICSFQDKIGQGFKLSHIQGSCSFCGTELQLQAQLLELMLLICRSEGKIQGGGFTCKRGLSMEAREGATQTRGVRSRGFRLSCKAHSRGVRRCTFVVFPSRHLKSFTSLEGGRNVKGYSCVD